MTDPRLADLGARIPSLRLLTELADLIHYGRDWTRRWGPSPLAVALPGTGEEVQAIVRWANEHGVALVPSGGRTGLSGGAVAAQGELVLSLERMNRVLGFDATDRLLEVEAGITLQAVHEAARSHGLLYPVDFAARGSCTIGGNVATNAGGIRVIRYGTTREWIAGLTVIAGNGERLELNRGLIKNSSGYDLRHLMVGSEGTLGVVVGAQLKLTDPSPPAQTMLLALPHMDALMQVFGLFRARLKLQAFEFFTDVALRHVLAHGAQRAIDADLPYYVVAEYDALDDNDMHAALLAFEDGVREGWISDGVIAQSEAQAATLWRLREGITESLAPRKPYKNDIALRIGAMPAFLREMQALLAREYPRMEVVWFGHIGDGNLHINVLPPEDMQPAEFIAHCERVTKLLADTLQRHGGSISAEHGIGLVKRAYLGSTRSAAEIALMRGMRTVFDPNGLLNPGKLV
ncbi:MAG TPA: FAD-binding oxidoreductase [Frateuria sp.]|uniref:FAD-binding oxidoreductase n=1 Tax=Frateuria sp. TaxID=2211372 RepID=UPI002D7E178C|nr:FAD-binding oxidoreductase [Frateuria sp.]HET6803900.1 FAD-binding oxidoreductase [Frateuria sp.]